MQYYVCGFPGGSDGEESACNAGDLSSGWKIPWRRAWQPSPVFLPGESPWTGGTWLADYSPWGHRVGHNQATKCAHTHKSTILQKNKLKKNNFLKKITKKTSIKVKVLGDDIPGKYWLKESYRSHENEIRWIFMSKNVARNKGDPYSSDKI